MKGLIFFLCVGLAVSNTRGEEGKKWALLVASANGWFNYGMQADVYHAYQVFREGGIPEEQIVVMAYDDIAQSEDNPFKGQVFQSYDLKDVYNGIKIDYRKESVNKNTFFAVLQGDKDAVKNLTGVNGKVIDSGPGDNVFIFISNHGMPGYVCWLDGNDMSAKELNETIASLHKNRKYKNLVLYVDTCFAGSMFENILADNIGVYAATASNATSYAYSTDCNSLAFADWRTCLGGLFSINWVYELQSDDRHASTMDMQFQEAKIACQGQSDPQQYGSLSISLMRESEFFGDSALDRKPGRGRRSRRSIGKASLSIPKHLLAYETLKNQLNHTSEHFQRSQQVKAKLDWVKKLMDTSDMFIKDIHTSIHGRFATDKRISRAETNFGSIKWSCYEPAVEAVRAHCPRMMRTEDVRYYAGAKFGVLVNLCNEVTTDTLLAAVKTAARINPLCG
ncbi:legumain [Elysia marginata]|uniref:Legumain n=1 Tax=Elysia marginata TaxID=1093978 RepID=A0AAV4JR00_9GAST|nr:legumain [Elysia marginata]